MAKNNDIFEYRDLKPEELAEVSALYGGTELKPVRVGPKGYYLPRTFKEMAADIYNMPLRCSDIFVMSYQRSGTTWTQELVWLLANDLNYEMAAAVPLTHRYPFLEIAMCFDDACFKRVSETCRDNVKSEEIIKAMSTPAVKILAEMSSPRFVKTHLPLSFLPPKLLDSAKVVYVARDPRDVIVSSYHHGKLFKLIQLVGDFKQLWNAFRKDLFQLTPYFEHVKEAWALRHHPNMLFLFYEELSKDLPGTIRRVAKFLNKDLNEEQMERLCNHLSIHNFKNNKSVNYEEVRELGLLDDSETFIRKGKSGGWREYFDEEMTREADQWIEENLRDSDLRFPSMQKQ